MALARQTRRARGWLDAVDAGYVGQPRGLSAIAVATAGRRLPDHALGGPVGLGNRSRPRQCLRAVPRQANRRDGLVPHAVTVAASGRCHSRRSLLLFLLVSGVVAGGGGRCRLSQTPLAAYRFSAWSPSRQQRSRGYLEQAAASRVDGPSD